MKGQNIEKVISAAFREELDRRELNITDEQTNGSVRTYEIGYTSDNGNEVSIQISVSRDAKNVHEADREFAKSLAEFAKGYDVSHEAYLWLDSDGHGKNGAPYEMIDVYRDFEGVKHDITNAARELTEWVEKQPEPVDVKTLKDIPGSDLGGFHEAIGKLTRPYIKITNEEYETIMRGFKGDVCYSPDGRQFTYGNCDLGYALMPLQEKYYFPVP